MVDFYIKNFSRDKAVDWLCGNNYSETNEAIIDKVTGAVFRTLAYNEEKYGIIKQYKMSKRMIDVLDYSEEEYQEHAKSLEPEGHFNIVNCFADAPNAEIVIQEELRSSYPEFQSIEEKQQFLQTVSETTKSVVKTLVAMYQEEHRAEYETEINTRYNSNIASLKIDQEEEKIIPTSPTYSSSARSSSISTDSASSIDRRSLTWAERVSSARVIAPEIEENGEECYSSIQPIEEDEELRQSNKQEWLNSIGRQEHKNPDNLKNRVQDKGGMQIEEVNRIWKENYLNKESSAPSATPSSPSGSISSAKAKDSPSKINSKSSGRG